MDRGLSAEADYPPSGDNTIIGQSRSCPCKKCYSESFVSVLRTLLPFFLALVVVVLTTLLVTTLLAATLLVLTTLLVVALLLTALLVMTGELAAATARWLICWP